MHEYSVAEVLVQRLSSWYRQQPEAPSVHAIRMRCGVSLSGEPFRQAFTLAAAGTPFASTQLLIDPVKGLSAVEVIEVVCGATP